MIKESKNTQYLLIALIIAIAVVGFIVFAPRFFSKSHTNINRGGNIKTEKKASWFSGIFQKNQSDLELIVEDLVIGTGETIKRGDRVSIHYEGRLFKTKEKFYSSYDINQPLYFTLGNGEVIGGLDEGIIGMSVGGERVVIVPPGLAYGASGKGDIPPDAYLIFEVQLVEIL